MKISSAERKASQWIWTQGQKTRIIHEKKPKPHYRIVFENPTMLAPIVAQKYVYLGLQDKVTKLFFTVQELVDDKTVSILIEKCPWTKKNIMKSCLSGKL